MITFRDMEPKPLNDWATDHYLSIVRDKMAVPKLEDRMMEYILDRYDDGCNTFTAADPEYQELRDRINSITRHRRMLNRAMQWVKSWFGSSKFSV